MGSYFTRITIEESVLAKWNAYQITNLLTDCGASPDTFRKN